MKCAKKTIYCRSVATLLVALLCFCFITPLARAQQQALTLGDVVALPPNDQLTVSHIINGAAQTITIQMVYDGFGWLSFAFAPNGAMAPNTAVIGLPDTGQVEVYELNGRAMSLVVPLQAETASSANLLTDPTSIEQNETHTILTFTQPLESVNNIIATVTPGASNTFIYAAGYSNTLGYHGQRGAYSMTFDNMAAAAEEEEQTLEPTDAPTASPTAALTTNTPTDAPTDAPAAEPTLEPTTLAPVPEQAPEPTTAVEFSSEAVLPLDSMTLRHVVDEEAQTMTIQLVYDGLAWIAFGFTPTGQMLDSTAVIGLPTEGTVQFYSLTGKAMPSQMIPFEDDSIVTNASIEQNDTHTILTFTQPLESPTDEDAGPFIATVTPGASNTFIYAAGFSNNLGFHAVRGAHSMTFGTPPAANDEEDQDANPPLTIVTEPSTEPTSAAQATPEPTSAPAPEEPMTEAIAFTSETTLPDPSFLLREMMNEMAQTVTIQLVYEGIGWLSFGFAPDGLMVGNTAVIGLPATGTVQFYSLEGKGMARVKPLEELDANTPSVLLTDASITQNDTHTVLTFTQLLQAPDDGPVIAAVSPAMSNTFIYAAGFSNDLGFHNVFGSHSIIFGQQIAEVIDEPLLTLSPTAAPMMNNVVVDEPSPAPTTALPELVAPPILPESASETVLPFQTMRLRHIMEDVAPSDQGAAGAEASKVVTIQLVYEGIGWLAFGFAPDGLMLGNTAIIGLPDEGTVKLYNLTGKAMASEQIALNDDDIAASATALLSNTSIVQNETHTTLTFTQPVAASSPSSSSYGRSLVESASPDEPSTFIYAAGFSNDLGYHQVSGSYTINFASVVEDETALPPDGVEKENDEDLTKPVLDCTLYSRLTVVRPDTLYVKQALNPQEETVTVEVVYEGLGWIAVGFTTNGAMIGNNAVIGLPEGGEDGEGDVSKYFLGGKLSPVETTLLAPERQTLTNTSIIQNETHTIMRFTKLLVEDGEVALSETEPVKVIFATGPMNALSLHFRRGSFDLSWTPCIEAGTDFVPHDSVVELFNPHEEYRTLWKAHGWLMALGWGILVPMAIGSSLLRSLLPSSPPGLWFKIHFYANVLALLLIVASFGIAVYVVGQSIGEKHFNGNNHKIVGLIVVLLAMVQGMNGYFRPSVNKAPPPVDTSSEDAQNENGEEDEESAQPAQDTAVDNEPKPVKHTTLRIAWEYAHRIIGAALLALAWYNVDTGLVIYATRYPLADGNPDPAVATSRAVFWGIVGTLTGLIIGLTCVIRMPQRKSN